MDTCYDIQDRISKVRHLTADPKRNALKEATSDLLAKFAYNPRVSRALEDFKCVWGMTFNAAVDRMNPHAIAGFLLNSTGKYYQAWVADDKARLYTFIAEEIAFISRCQRNGDLTTVRGGKVGKFYPRSYADTLEKPPHSFYGNPDLDDLRECKLKWPRPSKTTTKGEDMDAFNPAKIVEYALVCAVTLIDRDPFGSPSNMYDRAEDTLDTVANFHELTASQRLSAKSALELVKDQIESDDDRNGYSYASIKRGLSEGYASLPPTELINMLTADEDESESEDEPTPKAVTSPALEALDSGMETAINALLTQSTGGKVGDIRQVFTELSEAHSLASKLEDEIKHLKTRATAVPVLSGRAEVKVDGDTLTYRVEMVKASDIFKNPKTGKKLKQLDFDIPTLVWTDSEGKEVRHPQCPDIDEHYFFRATHLLKLCTAYIKGLNTFAHGHTGTGKTTLFEQFYARLGFPVFRVNLDSALERADLTGQVSLRSDGGTTVTHFEEGILPQAMVQPCALILDEMDAGRADLLFVIQRATEGKGLMLTEDGGRLVKPHPLFRFCATANSRGQGDEYGIYAGVRPLNGALLNRFQIFLEVEYLEEDEETKVLSKKFADVSDADRTSLVQFAKSMRKAFTHGEITVPMSPRDMFSICELVQFFDPILNTHSQAIETAITTVIVDRAPLDNRQRVIEIADKHFADCKFK